MRSDLLCRVWIGESWLRSQFACINITLPPHFPCTLWKVMLAQNVRFFASKSLQIRLVESESDIDTKSLQSFCIKIIPPPPSPCPPHPPCSPGIWCFVIYPTMHCNVSWLTIREVSVKKIICSRDCVVKKMILVTLFLGVIGKVKLLMLPAQGSESCQEFCSPSPSAPFPCYLPPPCSRWWELSNNYYQGKDRARGSSNKMSKLGLWANKRCHIIEITVKKIAQKALFGRSQITCSTRSLSPLLLLMLSLLPLAWLMTYLNKFEHEYLFRGFLVVISFWCARRKAHHWKALACHGVSD